MGSHNVLKHKSNIVNNHHPEEKENIITEKMLPGEEIYPNDVEVNVSLFRHKLKMRLDRCQEILKKIDHDSRRMKICFLQLMELVDNCKKIVTEEQEQNTHLLELLEGYHTRKTGLSSKTQTVSPMIAGVPIKKASIMLKRLDPLQEISSFSNSGAISRNSQFNSPETSSSRTLPESIQARTLAESIQAINTDSPETSSSRTLAESIQARTLAESIQARTLAESIQAINTDTLITPSRNQVTTSSLSITLPNCQVRCERWPNPVSSPSFQELHLKQASIHLIRLDPRLYILPENGSAEVGESENEAFHELEIESTSFNTISPGRIPMNVETDDVTPEANVRSSSPLHSPCARSTPLVVLKRLETEESCLFLNDSKPRSSSLNSSSDDCKIIEVLPTNEHYFANKRKSSLKCPVHASDNEDVQETPKAIKSDTIGRKATQRNCDKCKKIARNVNGATRKKVQNSKKSLTSISHNKIEDRTKKKKLAEKEVDEDPLEGPSWLYNDGTVKNAKFKRLKRIRQDYFASFYYLPPTIYSSSEDSGDEQTNKERKSSKLRKRKHRRN